jgi:hypothetical protein
VIDRAAVPEEVVLQAVVSPVLSIVLRNEDNRLDLVLKKPHNCDRFDTVESY